MKSHTPSVLLTALLMAGGAFAQGTGAVDIHRLPPGAGEASTMVGGRPNANPDDPRLLRSQQILQAEREQKRAERLAGDGRFDTRQMGAGPSIHRVPPDAGEASTVIRGRPNANPNDPRLYKSREELQAEREQKRAQRLADRESRSATRQMGAGPAIHRVPPDAGEASTMVGGSPNANPSDPRLYKSREELQAEREQKRAERREALRR